VQDIPSWVGLADCYSCGEKQPPSCKKKMRAAIRHCKSKFSRCSWNGDIYVPYHFQFLQYVVKLGGIIYPFVTRIIYADTCIQTGVMCQQTQLWPFRKKISLLSGPWEIFPEEESGPRVSCLFFTLTWPFMPCLSLPRPSPSSHPWNSIIHSIGSVSTLNAIRSSQRTAWKKQPNYR
jgi:hypothetical protein